MEKCKTIEAKIDFLKTLLEKLTLILLALGGGFGTLLVKYPCLLTARGLKKLLVKHPGLVLLEILNVILLAIISILMFFSILRCNALIQELNDCEEE